jgi:hypothetical protein
MFNKSLVEKRLLVVHHFGLCVAHMGCATNTMPLVTVYQWRISKYATHNLPIAICATSSLRKFKNLKKKLKIEKNYFF